MSTTKDLIEILHTICGQNIDIPIGINLEFLDGVLPTELFLSIPSDLKQDALYALRVEASRYRFQSIQEFWNCARDVFRTFPLDDRFNFDGCSAPCGLPTIFLHDRRARNAFREIHPRMKEKALLEFYHTCNKFERTPTEMKKKAMLIFNSYPTKIDLIVGATIYFPRSIRQDDLLSVDVSKALYAIPSSERAKAVHAFNDRLRKQSKLNMRELQSLAVSTFQEYSSTSLDCNHQQVDFDVNTPPSTLFPNQSSSSDDFQQADFDEDTAPSALSPNQSSIQTSSESSTKDTQDMVVDDNQTTVAEDAVSEIEISMSAELSNMIAPSTKVPRKASVKEQRAAEAEGKANRLRQQIVEDRQFVHLDMPKAERLEAAKTSTVCPELAEKFCSKFGKAGKKDLKHWEDLKVPGAVINVFLSHYLSSTYKAEEYAKSGTRLSFKHPKVINTIVDKYLKFGGIVGPNAFPGNWRPGDLVHLIELAFSPKDGGTSSISHLNKLYHRKKGIYLKVLKECFGMEDPTSVTFAANNELPFDLPHAFNKDWKDIKDDIAPDHPLSMTVKKVVDISQSIRKDLVQAVRSVMEEYGAKPVLVVNRCSAETKKQVTNYVSLLKQLYPKLPYTELYHPTWFAFAKIPYQVQWVNVTAGTTDVLFHFWGEKYLIGKKEVTKQEFRLMLDKKGMETVFLEGYGDLRYEPYTAEELEEIKNRKAGTAHANGSSRKGTKLTDEEKASMKRSAEENGNKLGAPKGKKTGRPAWNTGKKMTPEEIASRKRKEMRTAEKNGNTVGFQKGRPAWNSGKKMTVDQKAQRRRTAEKNGNTIGFQKGNYYGRPKKKSKK